MLAILMKPASGKGPDLQLWRLPHAGKLSLVGVTKEVKCLHLALPRPPKVMEFTSPASQVLLGLSNQRVHQGVRPRLQQCLDLVTAPPGTGSRPPPSLQMKTFLTRPPSANETRTSAYPLGPMFLVLMDYVSRSL